VRSALIRLHGTVPPRVSLLASVSLATFLVALLAATQFRSQPLPPSNRFARNQALTQSVNELEAQNRRLKSQVQSLQASARRTRRPRMAMGSAMGSTLRARVPHDSTRSPSMSNIQWLG